MNSLLFRILVALFCLNISGCVESRNPLPPTKVSMDDRLLGNWIVSTGSTLCFKEVRTGIFEKSLVLVVAGKNKEISQPIQLSEINKNLYISIKPDGGQLYTIGRIIVIGNELNIMLMNEGIVRDAILRQQLKGKIHDHSYEITSNQKELVDFIRLNEDNLFFNAKSTVEKFKKSTNPCV